MVQEQPQSAADPRHPTSLQVQASEGGLRARQRTPNGWIQPVGRRGGGVAALLGNVSPTAPVTVHWCLSFCSSSGSGCQLPRRDGHHVCLAGRWHGDVGTLPAPPSLLRCLGLDPPQSCPGSTAEASSEGRAIFGAVTGSNWVLTGVFELLVVGRFFSAP